MSKIKLAKFSPRNLILLGLLIINLLIISAPVASAFTGCNSDGLFCSAPKTVIADTTPSSAATVKWPCDPLDTSLTVTEKNSCICNGTKSLTDAQISKCSGPCDPSKALTQDQKNSCTCDGTPSLSVDQITACQDCQRGSGGCLKNNVIIKDIQKFVNFLSALVGIVVIGSIMVGGLQYAYAGDKAEAVDLAKRRIAHSLFAFLIYILTFAFLQWLIPGGIFK